MQTLYCLLLQMLYSFVFFSFFLFSSFSNFPPIVHTSFCGNSTIDLIALGVSAPRWGMLFPRRGAPYIALPLAAEFGGYNGSIFELDYSRILK